MSRPIGAQPATMFPFFFFGHLILTRRYRVIFSPQFLSLGVVAFSLPAVWIAVEVHLYGNAFLQGYASFVMRKVSSGAPASARNQILGLLEYPKFLLQRYWP